MSPFNTNIVCQPLWHYLILFCGSIFRLWPVSRIVVNKLLFFSTVAVYSSRFVAVYPPPVHVRCFLIRLCISSLNWPIKSVPIYQWVLSFEKLKLSDDPHCYINTVARHTGSRKCVWDLLDNNCSTTIVLAILFILKAPKK